ncbi:MAG: patatin-like protein [Acidobacteriales bacterium]|nr:patatin-like protein [Terriglobales bacterium]
MSTQPVLASQSNAPDPYTQDIRFAVVMYGGVSLCIYMNGVAQEMLNLSRATSRLPDAGKGTSAVYQRLSQALGGARFVVDVISGTSAGGINGIFLAKALANNQEMESLSGLWKEKGDLGVLLNDAGSKRWPVKNQKPPASLLNTRRMYLELLEAFNGMDGGEQAPSRHVNELDLFVTTTDITGQVVPLLVDGNHVEEKKHKQVFHFVYSTAEDRGIKRNDFKRMNNPFLAFAARCTSSFPVAFEPMTVAEMEDVRLALRMNPDFNLQSLENVYRPYTAAELGQRHFGDGGYLDNKPFSYPTELLSRRNPTRPVRRTLLYVEPDPEQLLDHGPATREIDFIANAQAALIGLPTYETIREDIDRIHERNRLIRRVAHVYEGIREDLGWIARSGRGLPTAAPGNDYAKEYLEDLTAKYGPAYGGYHRLKVAEVTDQLTALVSRSTEFGASPGGQATVRRVMQCWRYQVYQPLKSAAAEPGKHSETRFLLQFDLGYRLRRLDHIRWEIDTLSGDVTAVDAIVRDGVTAISRTEYEDLQAYLLGLKKAVSEIYTVLRIMQHNVWSAPIDLNTEETKPKTIDDLDALLKSDLSNTESRTRFAECVLSLARGVLSGLATLTQTDSWKAACLQLDRIARDPVTPTLPDSIVNEVTGKLEKLDALLHKVFSWASPRFAAVVAGDDSSKRGKLLQHLRTTYDRFECFDMALFPTLYSTGAGETGVMDIVRVSPRDTSDANNNQRLGGASLMHFSAFLERAWRENDILWGRMDAADRLIWTLAKGSVLDPGDTAKMVRDAQLVILLEELTPGRVTQLEIILSQAFPGQKLEVAVQRILAEKPITPAEQRAQLLLEASAAFAQKKEIAFLDDLKTHYEVIAHPAPHTALQIAARAIAVFGQMLDGVLVKRRVDPKIARYIALAGRAAVGMLEMATERSFAGILLNNLHRLAMLAALMLLAFGYVGGKKEVVQFGWQVFGAVLILYVGVWLLQLLLHRSWKKMYFNMFAALLTAIMLALAVFGGSQLYFQKAYYGQQLWEWLSALGHKIMLYLSCSS